MDKVKFFLIPGKEGFIPSRATDGSSGFDLVLTHHQWLHPGQRVLIGTGVALEMPEGWEAQIRPRSGLALRHGITVLNSPGTIDSDYRDEIKVLLINLGDAPLLLQSATRIAQLVFAPVYIPTVEVVIDKWPERAKRDGGFGSTG